MNDGRCTIVGVGDAGTTHWHQAIAYYPGGSPQTIATDPGDGGARTLTAECDGANRLVKAETNRGYTLDLTDAPGSPLLAHVREVIPADAVLGIAGQSRDDDFKYAANTNDPAAVSSLFSTASSNAGQAVLDQQYDASGAVVSRVTDTQLAKDMQIDPYGRLRAWDGGTYLYGADGQRSHVYTKATGEISATAGGLWDFHYKRQGTFFTRSRASALVGLGSTPLARVDEQPHTRHWMHTDVTGSVAWTRTGSSSGWARFDYTPFGTVTRSRGVTVNEERRFQGGVIDPSGLPYLQFGARLYDPQTYAWASRDPAYHDDVYGFVGGNPLAYADPSGLRVADVGDAPPTPREAPATASVTVASGDGPSGTQREAGELAALGLGWLRGLQPRLGIPSSSRGATVWALQNASEGLRHLALRSPATAVPQLAAVMYGLGEGLGNVEHLAMGALGVDAQGNGLSTRQRWLHGVMGGAPLVLGAAGGVVGKVGVEVAEAAAEGAEVGAETAEGVAVRSGGEVTEEAIRRAMQDAPLRTQQRAVSVPAIRRYVDRLASGNTAPPIKVDGSTIVDGNHRYIAGRLFGAEPAQVPGSLPDFRAGQPPLDWSEVFLDPVDWGNR